MLFTRIISVVLLVFVSGNGVSAFWGALWHYAMIAEDPAFTTLEASSASVFSGQPTPTGPIALEATTVNIAPSVTTTSTAEQSNASASSSATGDPDFPFPTPQNSGSSHVTLRASCIFTVFSLLALLLNL